MKIVVGSQSAVKLDAVKNAVSGLGIEADVIGVKADSGAPEQPVGDETLVGARNRAAHARQLAPDADMYVAIENGIFPENGSFIDKAAVLTVTRDGNEQLTFSKGVEFPAEHVAQARQQGFDKITVGKVMAAAGVVQKHDDPHADLGDKTPRATLVQEAVTAALSKSLGWAQDAANRTQAKRQLG